MSNEKRRFVISQLKDVQLPEGLQASVIARIFRIRRREALIHSVALATTSIGAGIMLWNSIGYTISEASSSGFIEYLHLLATDSDVALSMWREFITAAISSAPIIPTALACTISVIFVWSINRLYNNVRSILQHTQYTTLSHA